MLGSVASSSPRRSLAALVVTLAVILSQIAGHLLLLFGVSRLLRRLRRFLLGVIAHLQRALR